MSTKWRIFCQTEGGWQYEWADEAIADCPNDAGHTVDLNSLTIVGNEHPVLELIPNIDYIKGASYTRAASIFYDTVRWGPLSRVAVMSNMDPGPTSYEVEVYDRTNLVSLATGTFSNTGDFDQMSIGAIANPPTGEVILEINMKRTGGKANDKIYVTHITLFSRSESS